MNQESNKMLAHAYIPIQVWSESLYDLEQGLLAGTIFPCLNQPITDYEWSGINDQK